jgi:hypothetical protein
MAGRYTHITHEEFEEIMDEYDFFCINGDQATQEFVYSQLWHGDEYMLKVFSSIVESQGARDVGKDAIRVVLFIKRNNIYVPTWKGSRVYRVENWRENLGSRIREGFARGCKDIDWECPNCGGHLILRDGYHGLFYGCSNYPESRGNCKFTRNYED